MMQKITRRMGYLRDQDGIMNRYLRERDHWDQHLKRTRQFINDSFKGKTLESVAVLGSGWLLDVPLDEMRERFQTIYLVDIRHPPQIRKRTQHMNNVELLERDLTGGAMEQVWQAISNKGNTAPDRWMEEITLTSPLSRIKPDAIISVNLVSQLDTLLCEFLEKQGQYTDEQLIPFRAMIQSFHVKWISRNPGCLITDTLEQHRDKSGRETFKVLLHTDLPPGDRTERWSWDFDTHGHYRSGIRTRMEVQAVEWA